VINEDKSRLSNEKASNMSRAGNIRKIDRSTEEIVSDKGLCQHQVRDYFIEATASEQRMRGNCNCQLQRGPGKPLVTIFEPCIS
jgi:hypothetical protein